MIDDACEQSFASVVNATRAVVSPHGYRRSGALFRKIAKGNCAIIQFQRSRSNSGAHLKFTVNTSVVCGALLSDWQPPIDRAREMDGHLRNRLGFFLTPPRDTWWEIGADTDAARLIGEVASHIEAHAVPYLDSHLSTEALVALWRSGKAPGITKVQRDRYLAVLSS